MQAIAPLSRLCLLYLLPVTVFWLSCRPKNASQTKVPDTLNVGKSCPDSINPNGTSELAALMRRLADIAEENRRLLEENKTPAAWPDDINKLLTAQATDSDIKGSHYDAFAGDFIAAARSFNQSLGNSKESKSRHNAVVGACVSCHEQACAGPLVRIKKLYVN